MSTKTPTGSTNGESESNAIGQSIGANESHQTTDQVKSNLTPMPKEKSTTARPRAYISHIGRLFRMLILDMPLMVLFALYVYSILLHRVTVQYYIPQINLMKWNVKRQGEELTYYHRLCRDQDITTNNTADLLIQPDMDSEDCMLHMLTHGVSIYPGLISNQTAAAARDYILRRNKLEKNWGVISNKNRWSFGIDVNADPSIQQALKEIAANKQLHTALRKIIGRDAAVIEFTGITAAFGAADQYRHKDVVPRGSAFKFGRNFVPSYSLFIPLQDITADMGSTEVCPGTHFCTNDGYDPCATQSMFVSGQSGSWKSGFGALVNQQLYHRGTAHKDPNGPDRVLFILTFAGRPRFAKNQLESRLIGFEGSYSLKWDQWGHTLSDFANPEKHMIEPWRKLRAFGLYKKPTREWGWDYITVASMRIANEDTSYTPDDLETFVEEGGYFFIPSFLKAELNEEDGWTEYLLNQISKVMLWLQKVNQFVIAGYLASLALFSTIIWLLKVKCKGSFMVRTICRLIVTHGLVLLTAFLIASRVHSSQWAENIRLQKAFRGNRQPVPSQLRATLPNDKDVIIDQRLQSSFLASYNRVMDVHHPGNIEYQRLIAMNSGNYGYLPSSMQQDLTKMIFNEMRSSKHGRLLKQTKESTWATMSDTESLAQVHLDLMKANHEGLEFILTHLGYLDNEVAAGLYRETALHKIHIHAQLDALKKKLIGFKPLVQRPTPGACRPGSATSVGSARAPVSALPPVPSSTPLYVKRSIPTAKPKTPGPVAPWPSAWIQVGDMVDGLYSGTLNEYYSGVITRANANKGVLSVRYDDGEVDNSLCRDCVRPLRPYEIDQFVGVRKDNVYHEGRIVAMHDNNTFDVQAIGIEIQRHVTTADLRRFLYALEVGAVIRAKFQGVGDDWYRAKITKVNKDGTFDVEYSDGDKEYSVESQHIKF